ncbi:hypothetical protein S7711_05376 [Stachybotrys chartarum IBT 7711]|uniref:DUF8004 domain-containing protein n=1 Tax=Stachybotrys chartarum (strain CBS 109288 / IBT 7711) TaxID=1280523 RepID=A0A084B998_STACB|nr:hypothetical protein S7711_05376 [Stachybotrys chartarum IBT 7711]KFA49142.1 hypothetical protein S40293_06132 [Stachybotrys chartarum IBT 40293]
MPTSLSLSALLSNADSDTAQRRQSLRKASVDASQFWPTDTKSPHLVRRELDSSTERDYPIGEPVPPAPVFRRSKTWSNRLSSLLPSLITAYTDAPQQPPQKRKPVTLSKSTPKHGVAPSPPPPYDDDDSLTAENERMTGYGNDYAPSSSSLPRSFTNPLADPVLPPPLHLDMSDSTYNASPSFATTGTGVTADAPAKRGTLTKAPRTDDLRGQSVRPVSDVPQEDADTHKPLKLQKDGRDSKPQRLSGSQQTAIKSRQSSPVPEPRGRSSSTQMAPGPRENVSGSRIVSTPVNLRPQNGSQSPSRGRLRRSWLPGGRSRSNSVDVNTTPYTSSAWVMSDDAANADYNISFLMNAEKVPELWNENGDVLVYLYPRASGCGPSFKVPEFTVSSSHIFNELIQNEHGVSARSRTRSFGGRGSLSVDDASRLQSPTGSFPQFDQAASSELRLYLPIAPPSATGQLSAPAHNSTTEMDRLVAIRNLFAFLTGQPLVGTKAEPTIFRALVQVAALLQEFGFSSPDGTSFGNAVDLSFGFYMEQLGLADCRHSREKTIESLVLGERMRSMDLYSEAFAHAAGKYSAIIELQLPVYEMVSPQTRQNLERAHLDLVNRQHNVNEHLEQFDFPSLFSGIANSTSRPELKAVRFKIWRSSFNKMRHFVLNHYKLTFGSWPPKASSKKNPFAESGLNRLVLKALYSDMCALYDLLVDRNNLTSRVIDEVPAISNDGDKMIISALHNILSEYDRSKPPVLPPIPYDRPQLPSMAAVLETYPTLSPKEQSKFDKKIKEHELMLILNKAYNIDTNNIPLPFLDHFKEFELREARGKMAADLADQRIGYWLFLYVVLQSLPMLVVDAPGLSFTDGVEYFLCQPPMGNPPWVEDRQVRKMWYEVAGGGAIVELSTDTIMFSVEATYHRSHCWLAAKNWQGLDGAAAVPLREPLMSPLQPPPTLFGGNDMLANPLLGTGPGPSSPALSQGSSQVTLRTRTLSPSQDRASHAWRSSMALGLEPVPLDPPSLPRAVGSSSRSSSVGPRPPSSHGGSRSASMANLAAMVPGETKQDLPHPASTSSLTFDDILGDTQKKPAAKKKSKFF